MRKYLSLFCAAAFLAACTSTQLNPDGSPKGELHWPKKVTLDKHKGTFVSLANLANVRAGATRDELYYLLGRPHFSEGFNSREWDYLFYFATPGRGEGGVSSCQLKVLFDYHQIARRFYWKAFNPADGQCPPQKQSPTPKKSSDSDQVPQDAYTYTLDIDTLFAFNSSTLGGDGLESLHYLADQLKNLVRPQGILITGHSDRLGGNAYNQRLSEARAMSVRAYLIGQGLPAAIIAAQGKGESDPVQICPDDSNRAALIACLAPNRRIEVVVNGSNIY